MKYIGRPKCGKNISHSKEENLTLVRINLSGESLKSLERETSIHNSQISKWTKLYLEGKEQALILIEELEFKMLKLERELLKKTMKF